MLRSTNRPYGVEVVGDPYDAFSPGTGLHPLRGLFRRRHCRRLKDQCARASAAAYVTGGTLKKRYPPAPETFTATYSSVELPEEFLAAQPRRFDPGKRSFRLISVGSLDHLYKAPDVLIDAVGECVRRGWDLELALVGGEAAGGQRSNATPAISASPSEFASSGSCPRARPSAASSIAPICLSFPPAKRDSHGR